MYISSFNTYIGTDSSQKAQRHGTQEIKRSSSSFETKLLSKTVKSVETSSRFPINYISNYKALNNQQKLQANTQNSSKIKFQKIEAMSNAQSAYGDNTKIFSQILPPRATLDQTPRIDKKLPQNIQDIKEKNLRHTMLNTYITNENYYRVTA